MWGCGAVVHRDFKNRGTIGTLTKTDPRGLMCMMIGYDDNDSGWRLRKLVNDRMSSLPWSAGVEAGLKFAN